MQDEKERKNKGLVDDGDPYVIVVSSGGPPNDGNDPVDDKEDVLDLKFPFSFNTIAGSVHNVMFYAEYIDSSENHIKTETMGPYSIDTNPLSVEVKVDYSVIPHDALTLLRLKWGYQNEPTRYLLLTVPFSYPFAKKEFLKKVDLKYMPNKN